MTIVEKVILACIAVVVIALIMSIWFSIRQDRENMPKARKEEE